jgi:transcriptional regulator with XRE-family HTH domain
MDFLPGMSRQISGGTTMKEVLPQNLRALTFSQLLAEKRMQAGLSLLELADLARLPVSLLEDLEHAEQSPSFDVCYKIASAINSRRRQSFLIQDLWQAASRDRAAHIIRAAYGRMTRREVGVEALIGVY